MGTWIAPLTKTPIITRTPMAEALMENSVSANTGRNAQMTPMHVVWASRKEKSPAIVRSERIFDHPRGLFLLCITRSILVEGRKTMLNPKPMKDKIPMQANAPFRLKWSLITPPRSGPALRPMNRDMLNSPMIHPSLPGGVISPTYAWTTGMIMADAIPWTKRIMISASTPLERMKAAEMAA